MIILVDMDGTICDWNSWFDHYVEKLFPDLAERLPKAVSAKEFDLFKGLGVDEAAALTHVFNHEGFYADIPPLPGALEAVREMIEDGHIVKFVTSPWYENPTCMQDKADWLKAHLGAEALSHLIITKDKTMVVGDLLFDDKPEIEGDITPMWRQILIDHTYNRESDLPRLTDWANWRDYVYTYGRQNSFA